MHPTTVKRSVEAKDLFLILLGWAIHKVLDIVWEGVKGQRVKNRSKSRRQPWIQVLGNKILELTIGIMTSDPERRAWIKKQVELEHRARMSIALTRDALIEALK